MAKCELSIKDTYVQDWGIWECIREAMQNGLDEDDRGHKLSVSYEDGALLLHNSGADLKVQSLVLGEGDKVGQANMRGKHCEGLSLSLLAGVRSGAEVWIRTPSEKWTVTVEDSTTWGIPVLVVRTRKTKPHSGVTVSISLQEDLWKEYKNRFLYFKEPEGIQTSYGRLLTGEDHRGMLFDKGIFVQKKSGLKYGYDFLDASLDRDRRFISTFNFEWETSRILEAATQANPEFAETLIGILKDDGPEARALLTKAPSDDVKERIAEEFRKEHGDRAVPVRDTDGSRDAAAMGRKGVVVSRALDSCLRGTKVSSLEAVKEECKKEVIQQYAWEELSSEEQQVFSDAKSIYRDLVEILRNNLALCGRLGISKSLSQLENFSFNLTVVEFSSEATRGQFVSKDGEDEILVARRELTSPFRLLRVGLHEQAHSVSRGKEYSIRQTYAEAEILIALAYVCSLRGLEG